MWSPNLHSSGRSSRFRIISWLCITTLGCMLFIVRMCLSLSYLLPWRFFSFAWHIRVAQLVFRVFSEEIVLSVSVDWECLWEVVSSGSSLNQNLFLFFTEENCYHQRGYRAVILQMHLGYHLFSHIFYEIVFSQVNHYFLVRKFRYVSVSTPMNHFVANTNSIYFLLKFSVCLL